MERQGKKQAELVKYLDLPLETYINWKLGKSRNLCEHLILLIHEVSIGKAV